jgi:hypothetical protein
MVNMLKFLIGSPDFRHSYHITIPKALLHRHPGVFFYTADLGFSLQRLAHKVFAFLAHINVRGLRSQRLMDDGN